MPYGFQSRVCYYEGENHVRIQGKWGCPGYEYDWCVQKRYDEYGQDREVHGLLKAAWYGYVLEEAAGPGDDAAGGWEVVFQEGFGGGHYCGV